MTLRTRLAAVAGIAVALTVIGLAAADYEATSSSLRSQVDSALNERVQPLLNDHDGGPGGRPDSGPNGGYGGPFGGATGVSQSVAPDGTTAVPLGQTSTLPVDRRTRALAASGTGRFYRDATVAGVHLRILAVGVGDRGAVQVARPLTEVDRSLSRLLWLLALVGAGGILVAAVLGAVVARTALKPVRRFTAQTEALTGDPDISHRLEERGRDELTRLARSFNATLAALEASVEAQRSLIADASHELRTPIASLRANIQVLEEADRLPPAERESLRADLIAELDELTALVGDIVELARGAKPGDAVDDIRLDLIVRSLIERFERRAGDGPRFDADLEPTVVSGEPDRISRAVSNLLDNARKWSPPGAVVEVGLAGGTVTVRDHGPGFDEADIPHVFDRFYRARKARGMPGSGLGLAIVRQAAEAHGGAVEAANAPDGGAVVSIRFGPSLPAAKRVPARLPSGQGI
jgi:two-component system sensor histidine kinase MprB